MQKQILITVLLAVGVCYGQLEMPDCPSSILDFGAWLPKVLSNCQKQMIKALRESKDNCEEKVGTVGPCLTTEQDRCTEALADDDMLKNIIDQTLNPIIASTEFYSYIYCSTGPIADIALTTTVQGCPREMEAASLACHAPYVEIFNEDRVDVRLCDAYNTMVTCETDKVMELCTDADVETVSMDDMTRRMGNYYCIDDDEAPGSPSEENPCPTSMMEFGFWSMKLITNCIKQMIIDLRQSKDNCPEKVGKVGTCMDAAKDQCTEGLADTDMLKHIIESALGDIIGQTAMLERIYCSTGPVMDITMNTTVMGCSDEMRTASLACHAPFMDIFNADRVDVKLCEAYETMVTCETGKVNEFCASAPEDEKQMDDLSRRIGNLFCVDGDENADDTQDTLSPTPIGGDATLSATPTISDDIISNYTLSATSNVVSFFTFTLANIISIYIIL